MPNQEPLTFRDLQLQALRWIDEGEDADITLTLVKEAINRSHRQVLTARVWPFMLWPNEETLTTTAGTRKYALKPGIGKLLTLWDTTARTFVPLIPRREWEGMGVDRTEQVLPLGAIYGDWWPVKAQPTSATTLSLVSTSASDTTVTVQLTGLDSDGEYLTETVTMTGTTPVATSGSFAFLLGVTKIGTWVGTLTLSTSGGTSLLVLKAAETSKQYPTLEFVETPEGTRSYTWTAQRMPTTLVNDNDIPDTPAPFSQIHVYDALLDLTAYNTELGAKEQRLWQSRRDELMRGLENYMDETIAGSRPRFVRNMEPQLTRRIITTS